MRKVHQAIKEAEKKVNSQMAEATALVEIFTSSPEWSPETILAMGTINRLAEAIEELQTEILRHGIPSLKERN